MADGVLSGWPSAATPRPGKPFGPPSVTEFGQIQASFWQNVLVFFHTPWHTANRRPIAKPEDRRPKPQDPIMLAAERRNRLLELVRAKRFASLPELVEQLGASESTIRRDLAQLEEQGLARRIHGGVLYTGNSPKLPHFDAQQPAQWEKKKAIAAAAVELIEDGDYHTCGRWKYNL